MRVHHPRGPREATNAATSRRHRARSTFRARVSVSRPLPSSTCRCFGHHGTLLEAFSRLFPFSFFSASRASGGVWGGRRRARTDRTVSGKTESGNSCDGRISRVRETRSLHTWILGDTRKSYVKLFLLRYLVNSGERAATPLAISRNIRN